MDYSKLLEELRLMATKTPIWRLYALSLAVCLPLAVWQAPAIIAALK